jgi:hypothetical protein
MSLARVYYAYVLNMGEVEHELEQCNRELLEVQRIVDHMALRFLQHARGLIELSDEERFDRLQVYLRRELELKIHQTQLKKMHQLMESLLQLVRVGVFLNDRPVLRIYSQATGLNTFPRGWKNKSFY